MYREVHARPLTSNIVGEVQAGSSATTTTATSACVVCRKRKLKCDRSKPKCGTCVRLKSDCKYPEPMRRMSSRRRNTKELEARLVQIEARLRFEATSSKKEPPTDADQNPPQLPPSRPESSSPEPSASFAADNNVRSQNPEEATNGIHTNVESLERNSPPSSHLLSMGVQEPLPPEPLQQELFGIYFAQVHPHMPMIHEPRFFAALKLGFNRRPPICLQYAMWCMAASVSQKYEKYSEVLYERARKYSEAAEMKSRGEEHLTVHHAQCWHLIATFEAQRAYVIPSWMSTGRCVRLVQMMGLQCIDKPSVDIKKVLPNTKDNIELEERRRTFWAAYFGDRWASAGTGWPMSINENEIFTRLPASEMAFEHGTDQTGVLFSEAFNGYGTSQLLSPFAGLLLAATLLGRNFGHIRHNSDDDNPKDIQDGKFWNRHRELDNTLSNTFMYLPEYLKPSQELQDLKSVFLYMSLHVSVICLHQAAIITAMRNRLDPSLMSKSMSRCLIAADEIYSLMKASTHYDIAKFNPWTGFALYIAGRVYCHDIQIAGPTSLNSSSSLNFLLTAMSIFSKHSLVIRTFTIQLESEFRAARLATYSFPPQTGIIGEITSGTLVDDCSNSNNEDISGNSKSTKPPDAQGEPNLSLSSLVAKPPLYGILIGDEKEFLLQQLAESSIPHDHDVDDSLSKTHSPASLSQNSPVQSLDTSSSHTCDGTHNVGVTRSDLKHQSTRWKEWDAGLDPPNIEQSNANSKYPVAWNNQEQNQAHTTAGLSKLRTPTLLLEEDCRNNTNNFRKMSNHEISTGYNPSYHNMAQSNIGVDHGFWTSQHWFPFLLSDDVGRGLGGTMPDDYAMETDVESHSDYP